jgi:integrase
MVSHRLRHTFATSLLNAGMSLLGVMKLLGHRDYRMTLRYAAITQETVGKEYFEALSQIEAKYRIPARSNNDFDPVKLLSDVIRWIQNHARNHRRARSLVRRLRRLQTDLQQVMSHRDP